MVPFWLSGEKDTGIKNIAVIDRTGKYSDTFHSDETYHFHFLSSSSSTLLDLDYYALLLISGDPVVDPSGIALYSDHNISPEFTAYLSGMLNTFIEEKKIEQYNLPFLKEIIDNSKSNITIQTKKWNVSERTEASSEPVLLVSIFATFLIYFFIIIYGSQVMRGVSEEKTSRIVEIIISSVKPFELMMGKIIGIALVGLTQFLIWSLIISLIFSFAGSDISDAIISDPQKGIVLESVLSFNWTQMGFFFIIYFLGGYFLYASLFAAIGAASDPETDSQQFIVPVTLPVFFAFFAAIYVLNNPDGSFAFWTSIIPFTSPIVMMVRISLGVSPWELILSVGILIITFILTTKLAGRIYRTGILMYGKKIGYKEIWKMINS
jgi:ABC-2 type transport system permease protein